MFTSQFDGNSAFSGGGFMSSQSSQGIDSGFSPAKSRETPAHIPVTMKQIKEASHSGDEKPKFVVGSVDVSNVTVVGLVSGKAVRVTDVGFTLDDGTGRINCNRWINEGHDSKEMENIEDGMYVRVNGHIRSFQGKRQIVAFSARPVTKFDEIAFHFIECIHFHLQNSRVQSQGDALNQSQMMNSSLNLPASNGSSEHQTPSANHSFGHFSVDGRKDLDKIIIEYLQQPSNSGREKGVHRDELSQNLKIPLDKMMESIRTLEEEGLIYSTVDEFHYKSITS